MALFDQISEDIKSAMKARDKVRLATIYTLSVQTAVTVLSVRKREISSTKVHGHVNH